MTFYALISVRSAGWGVDGDGLPIELWEVAISPISEAAASAQKAVLMVDVTSFGFEPGGGGQSVGRILFNGPLVPGADPEATGVEWAQGQTSIPYQGDMETISVYINRIWCDERSIDGFIFEYEALAEMVYSEDGYYGDPRLWLFGYEMEYVWAMSAYSVPTGLGLSSFKIFSAEGIPPEPFWAGLQNCAETV